MTKSGEALIDPKKEDVRHRDLVLAMAQADLPNTQNGQDDRLAAERAFGELYDATVHRVYFLVRRFIRDEGAAHEVTADVFHQAWVQAHRFDSARGSVIAWLLIMARSRSLDACRRQTAQRVIFDSEVTDAALAELSHVETPLDILLSIDSNNALHRALTKVAPTARQMIGLAFYQGLTYSEISEHLKMPLGTVKTVIRRALRALRADLMTLKKADQGCFTLLPVELEPDARGTENQHE
jgi:RNA polymerase sigma factor (sigma-70 family)